MKTRKGKQAATAPQIIKMTKIKQWYVVADVESYKLLSKCGVAMIRVHQNFLPTLGLVTEPRDIKIKGVDFTKEILDPFLEKTTATWGRKYGKVQLTNRVIVFTAQTPKGQSPDTDENLQAAKTAIDKLESILQGFFSRWGYRCNTQYSEASGGTKIKFHVEYWFDSEKMPVLPMETPAQELKNIELKFGFARLVLSFDNRLMDIKKISTDARRSASVDPALNEIRAKAKTVEEGEEKVLAFIEAAVRRAVDEERTRTRTAVDYINVRFEVSQGGVWSPIHTSKCLPSQISNVLPMVNSLMQISNLDPHNEDNAA